MNFQTINASASPEVQMNENFETADYSAVYGKRQPVTTGLTWGYCGGRWGGFSIIAGTVALTDDADNYLVVAIASGALTASTATTNWNNDADYVRVYKITTASGVVTAVEDHRAGPGGVHGGLPPETPAVTTIVLAIACSDETTALTTGVGKAKFINPYPSAFTVTAVVASLSTAQASGSIFTVDINEAGTTILSTKLTIDNGEKNSSTAATAAVISDASIAAYAEISVDIDQIGDGTAAGLKVYLLGTVA